MADGIGRLLVADDLEVRPENVETATLPAELRADINIHTRALDRDDLTCALPELDLVRFRYERDGARYAVVVRRGDLYGGIPENADSIEAGAGYPVDVDVLELPGREATNPENDSGGV